MLPSAVSELRRRAHAQLGSGARAGRLLEEILMASRRYQPTPDQAEDPVLRRAWSGAATEEETIQAAFEELRELRARLHHFEGTVSE